MRTTLTIDPDVARLLEDEVHRQRKPLKQVVNDALRRGLSPKPAGRKPAPYKVTGSIGGLQPGFDPLHLNRLVGELEDEEYIRRAQRDERSK